MVLALDFIWDGNGSLEIEFDLKSKKEDSKKFAWRWRESLSYNLLLEE